MSESNDAGVDTQQAFTEHPLMWVQKWVEHEKGWGSRPDGWSLHRTREDIDLFRAAIREREQRGKPEGYTPDEYSAPTGEPYQARIDDEWLVKQARMRPHGCWAPRDKAAPIPALSDEAKERIVAAVMALPETGVIKRYQQCVYALLDMFNGDPLPAEHPAHALVERLEALIELRLIGPVPTSSAPDFDFDPGPRPSTPGKWWSRGFKPGKKTATVHAPPEEGGFVIATFADSRGHGPLNLVAMLDRMERWNAMCKRLEFAEDAAKAYAFRNEGNRDLRRQTQERLTQANAERDHWKEECMGALNELDALRSALQDIESRCRDPKGAAGHVVACERAAQLAAAALNAHTPVDASAHSPVQSPSNIDGADAEANSPTPGQPTRKEG